MASTKGLRVCARKMARSRTVSTTPGCWFGSEQLSAGVGAVRPCGVCACVCVWCGVRAVVCARECYRLWWSSDALDKGRCWQSILASTCVRAMQRRLTKQLCSHFLPGVHTGCSPALQKSSCAKHTQSVSLVFVSDCPGQHDCGAVGAWWSEGKGRAKSVSGVGQRLPVDGDRKGKLEMRTALASTSYAPTSRGCGFREGRSV
jgi:hypothetical protein